MNKKILIILICAVICSISFICAYTIQKGVEPSVNISASENTSQGSIQENIEQTHALKTSKENKVVATQKKPDKPQKRGTRVPIYCSITNKGFKTIYNIKAGGQSFNKDFKTLKPGETRKFTYMEYIPFDSEMEEDMPGSGPLPNPYGIGGFLVTFEDAKGISHWTQSNHIKIKWYN